MSEPESAIPALGRGTRGVCASMSVTNPDGVLPDVAVQSAPLSFFRFLLNGVIFFAALMISCFLGSRILPFPEVPVVSDKLAHLARHGDDYDAIFIGSSRVNFQIIPTVFDRTATDEGLAVRSFNAGVEAMAPPEDGYFMDQVLRQPHRRLRWVFIEIMSMRMKTDPRFGTARFIYWHDWERTSLLGKCFLREWLAVPRSRPKLSVSSAWNYAQAYEVAYDRWGKNLRLFAENFTNLGRGGALLDRQMKSPRVKEAEWHDVEEVGDGWRSPRQDQRMTKDMLAGYMSAYTTLLETPQRFDTDDEASEEALRRMIAKLKNCGVTPILIIPPTAAPKRFFPTKPTAHSQIVLDFSDPRKYPELFTPDHRLDEGHLNVAGSEIFTTALALRFAKLNSAREP